MRRLDLQFNKITGVIPDEIGRLTNLVWFAIGYNYIEGEINKNMINLNNIKVLIMNNNNLSGGIPFNFNKLTRLRCLYLSNNKNLMFKDEDIHRIPNLSTLILDIDDKNLTVDDKIRTFVRHKRDEQY